MKHRDIRQFRSRQGRSDEKYKSNLKILVFSLTIVLITIVVSLIKK